MNILRRHRSLKYLTGVVVATVPAIAYFRYQNYNTDHLLLTLAPLRFGRAALTGASIVIDYKISLSGLSNDSQEYKEALSKAHTRSAERLKTLCLRNGGCYTKVGQHLGVLDHLIPQEYVVVMRTLHTHSTPSPIHHIYKVIKQDLKKEVFELFSFFDDTPLASASLAQVHKACLADGTMVVVKVQHPHVEKTSKSDITSMQLIFNLVSYLFEGLELDWLVQESRRNLPLELDFQNEALNSQKASSLFKSLKFLKIPKVHREFTTKRVLTMEYCEGGFINDLAFIKEHNISIKKVVSHLSDLYAFMIFRSGFVHCDPHPGNLLISPPPHASLVLLDHGLYQTFQDSLRLAYCRIWKAILEGDEKGLEREAEKLGVKSRYRLLACILTGRSWSAIKSNLSTEYTSQEESLIRNSAPHLFNDITSVISSLPRPLVFLLKTNDLIRGVCRSLNFKPDVFTRLHIAKSCLTAIYEDRMARSASMVGRWYLRCCFWWHSTRLTLAAVLSHLRHLVNSPKPLHIQAVQELSTVSPSFDQSFRV